MGGKGNIKILESLVYNTETGTERGFHIDKAVRRPTDLKIKNIVVILRHKNVLPNW